MSVETSEELRSMFANRFMRWSAPLCRCRSPFLDGDDVGGLDSGLLPLDFNVQYSTVYYEMI